MRLGSRSIEAALTIAAERSGRVGGPGGPCTKPNACINIIYTNSHLHLENFWDRLEFLAAMSHSSTNRSLLSTLPGIPVGIIISILVIVPGPA